MILEITLSDVGRIRNKRVLGDLVHVWVPCEIMILEITPDSSAKKRPQTLILEMTPVFSVNWPQTYRMLEEFRSKVCEVIWFILGSSVKLNYDFGNDLRLINCWKNPDQKCLRWRLPEGHPLLPTHSQCLFTTRTALENLQDFVGFFASKVGRKLVYICCQKLTSFCIFSQWHLGSSTPSGTWASITLSIVGRPAGSEEHFVPFLWKYFWKIRNWRFCILGSKLCKILSILGTRGGESTKWQHFWKELLQKIWQMCSVHNPAILTCWSTLTKGTKGAQKWVKNTQGGTQIQIYTNTNTNIYKLKKIGALHQLTSPLGFAPFSRWHLCSLWQCFSLDLWTFVLKIIQTQNKISLFFNSLQLVVKDRCTKPFETRQNKIKTF